VEKKKTFKYLVFLLGIVFLFLYIFLTYRCFWGLSKDFLESKFFSRNFKPEEKETLAYLSYYFDSFSYEKNYLNGVRGIVCKDDFNSIYFMSHIEYISGNYLMAKIFFEKIKGEFENKISKLKDKLKEKGIKDERFFFYMKLADCCFKLGDVKGGEKYLKIGIKNVTPPAIKVYFWENVPYIKSLYLFYMYKKQKGKKPFTGYYIWYRQELALMRYYVYMLKFEREIRKIMRENFSGEISNEELDKFFNTSWDEELLKIVSVEKKKSFVEIDVEKYFKSFEEEVGEKVSEGRDLKKCYPKILEAIFFDNENHCK